MPAASADLPAASRPDPTAAPDEPVRRSASRLVIAVDGPSGSGKSSTARGVARRLGLRYLDTGAMYRAMTLWMLEHDIDLDDPDAIAAHAEHPKLDVGTDPNAPTIDLDGADVSGPIRSREVTNAVSAVSAVPAIRAQLVSRQRELIDQGGVVVEGRDIGTVVAPDAPVKVFLDADPAERARRRSAEGFAGVRLEHAVTHEEMRVRDHKDSNRQVSPLTRADDATVVDTTSLELDEVVERIVALAHAADPNRGSGSS